MNFIVFLLTIAVVYCLYELYHLKKKIEDDKTTQAKSENSTTLFVERLRQLKHHTCEITLKEPLIFIDVMYKVKGKIIDSDHEWVLISCMKNKKEQQKIIRISVIKDMKEIL